MNTNPSAKTILCYGDSNTWGNVPRSDARYPRNVRWPGKLQELLGNDYEVISEALCGRTFVAVDPEKPHRTGITHLHAIIESHDPIDVIVIMLGTNDMKVAYKLSPKDIATDLDQTLQLIKSDKLDIEKVPQIIVICPPKVIVPSDGKLDARMVNAVSMSAELPAMYKNVAERHGALFIDANDHIQSSDIDGYHFTAEGHVKLAEVINRVILPLI